MGLQAHDPLPHTEDDRRTLADFPLLIRRRRVPWRFLIIREREPVPSRSATTGSWPLSENTSHLQEQIPAYRWRNNRPR